MDLKGVNFIVTQFATRFTHVFRQYQTKSLTEGEAHVGLLRGIHPIGALLKQDSWLFTRHFSLAMLWKVKWKLDGVGPVDNRPSNDKLHHFVRKKKRKKLLHVTCDTWHVTHDMWHVTHDTWHVTCDTWHVTHDTWHVWGGWTFSQNFSSLALTVCDLWYYEDLEEKDRSVNQWINELITRLFIEQPRLHRVC